MTLTEQVELLNREKGITLYREGSRELLKIQADWPTHC